MNRAPRLCFPNDSPGLHKPFYIRSVQNPNDGEVVALMCGCSHSDIVSHSIVFQDVSTCLWPQAQSDMYLVVEEAHKCVILQKDDWEGFKGLLVKLNWLQSDRNLPRPGRSLHICFNMFPP